VLQVCTPRLRDPGSGSQPGVWTRVSAAENIPPVPESYGGEGANALAAVIIIEEVARACASSFADPRGQQAGHGAAAAVGLGRPQAEVPAAGGPRGRAVLNTHSEAGAGSDAAGMKTRAVVCGGEVALVGGLCVSLDGECQWRRDRAWPSDRHERCPACPHAGPGATPPGGGTGTAALCGGGGQATPLIIRVPR
jgi:hypothetical protein